MRAFRSSRPRGATLILSLVVTVAVAIIGMGFLAQQRLQYQAISVASQEAAATSVAEAGIEDALTKLLLDADFPPLGDDDSQVDFEYAEPFTSMDGSTLGTYSVHVDLRWRSRPHGVLVVTSVGTVGPLERPVARRTIRVEVDVLPQRRRNASETWQRANPEYMKVIQWQEM